MLLLSGNALVVFKTMVFESFLLSGLAMWAWVFFHTRSFAAALLAGAAFTFAPWRMHNLPHPQYLGFQYLPLALLGVDLNAQKISPGAENAGHDPSIFNDSSGPGAGLLALALQMAAS